MYSSNQMTVTFSKGMGGFKSFWQNLNAPKIEAPDGSISKNNHPTKMAKDIYCINELMHHIKHMELMVGTKYAESFKNPGFFFDL